MIKFSLKEERNAGLKIGSIRVDRSLFSSLLFEFLPNYKWCN